MSFFFQHFQKIQCYLNKHLFIWRNQSNLSKSLHNINSWTIQLGITRRNSHTYYGQKVKVQRVLPHPQYNLDVMHDNDIALFQVTLKLEILVVQKKKSRIHKHKSLITRGCAVVFQPFFRFVSFFSHLSVVGNTGGLPWAFVAGVPATAA